MTSPALASAGGRDDALAVKLIGLGGVGGIVARYAALYLASLAESTGAGIRLVLVDGDAFEARNSARMFFRAEGNKAEGVREELLDYRGETRLSIAALPTYVTPGNIDRLVREGDVVLLAVDNHATRKLVSDFCERRRHRVCLISGGNDGVGEDSTGRETRGTYGNCQIFVRRDGGNATPPLTAHHPEIRDPADRLPTDASCLDLVATVPQILFANLAVASAMLSTLWLYLRSRRDVVGDERRPVDGDARNAGRTPAGLPYGEVCFDIAEGLMRPVASGR